MPTSDISQRDIVQALPPSDTDPLRQQLAGKGNLLTLAQHTLDRSTRQLRSLLSNAPGLQQTLHTALKDHLQVDPYHCGLCQGDRQVTLLTFAARLAASPVYANPFSGWSTWGLAETNAHAKMTAADWVTYLAPIVNKAKLQATRGYWDARMPGTDISRQAHATTLLRQHFTCSLDLAYGLGLLETNGWLQGRQPQPHYLQLQWQAANGRKLTSTAALVIGPQSDETHWLLYLPGMLNTVQAFSDLERLRDWVYQSRYRIWSDPRTAVTPGTRDNVLVTALQGDGHSALMAETLLQYQAIADHHLLQAIEQSSNGPLDWTDLQAWEDQRRTMVLKALLPTVVTAIDAISASDAAQAKDEVHFPCLEQHLPLGWRQQLIERQESLLEHYLEADTAPSSAKVTLLRERQAALDLLQDSHDIYLLDLPDEVTRTDLQVRIDEKTRAQQITEGLCQALLKEARLQNTMGELSDTHLGWVEQLADRPESSLQRSVEVCTLELACADRTWQLCGYLTFRAIHQQDDAPQDHTLLLYRPGHRGGLLAFDDEAALARGLIATLHGAWPDALLESAYTPDGTPLLDALSTAPSVTFKHSPIQAHFMQHCVQAIVDALPANTRREQARQRLCISENRARATALARFAEKNRSSHAQTHLMPLHHLDDDQLVELANQVDAQKNALRAAVDLLKSSLPTPRQFARRTLRQHLRREFGLQNLPEITLNIADTVTLKKEVTGQSALGGAGARDVPVFSETRSDVSLESFILGALDDERRLRLGNATLTFQPAGNPVLEQTLTTAYIARLIAQLDAAGRYETRITNTYLGFDQESPWQVEWRHETFRAPYEHRLRLLVLCRPTHLDGEGQRLLETFCHEQVNTVAARTVEYQSLQLRPGTAADGSSDSVGLSSIHLIKGASGPVLLYMPDAPNGTIISQHASPHAACEALQDMALAPKMARFLALQAQSGDPDEHESFINTALQKQHSTFIGVGSSRTETLPTYECRQDMGELIRSHRATSRSQADLALAAPEQFDRYFFLGLRLALGILPGAGTVLALYDGWHVANDAVRAFGKGHLEEGLQHLLGLLQCLTDAILTLAPLVAGTAKPALTARLQTQHRQRLDPRLPMTGVRKSPPSPFLGYEAELPAGPMVRSTLAHGAGVFEHTASQQHYISRNNAWYGVEWDPAYLTWRLKPQGTRAYRQPVRLTEQGIWDTPGRLGGLLVDNGLAGGGGALTTLYNQGVAYWRVRLHRQPQPLIGMELAHDINDELKRIVARMRSKQAAYQTARQAAAEGLSLTDAQKTTIANARRQLSDELNRNIAFNTGSIQRLRAQRSTLNRADYTRFTSLCEENISELSVLDMHLVAERFTLAADQVQSAISALQALSGHTVSIAQVKRLTRNSLIANQEMIETLQEVERLATRHHARRNHLQGRALTDYLMKVEGTNLKLDVANAQLVRTSILSLTLFNTNAIEHPQMGAFMLHFHEKGVDLRSTLYSHVQLPEAGLTRAQERSFLASAQSHYARYLNHVTAWEDTFKDLLSPNETQSLRQLMRQLIADIEDNLAKATAKRPRPTAQPGRGPSRPRLFETAERPLIGHEYIEQGRTRMRINQPDSDLPHAVYDRNQAGQWQLSAPERAAPTQTMSGLVDAATTRLDDIPRQQARLRQYQTPHAVPVDLEDIAEGHAQQLRFIANRIRQKAGSLLAPEHANLTQRLETAANQMHALGRQLRTAQTKATSKPTVGYLEDLLEQQEVQIAWSRTLKPKTDRKGNPVEYLEEYRIDDRVTQQPLWYAHFHFRQKPAQGFTRLEAGHLKLASERDLGEGAWRGSMSEAQANRLFGNLRPPR